MPMPRLRTVALVMPLLVGFVVGAARADDELTRYELLDPTSHAFAITYDVTTSRQGARFYLNGIRRGSEVRDERVLDRATGEELDWELIDGAEARRLGLAGEETAVDARFLKVDLGRPVPEGGEIRLRIIKTYVDPASYRAEGDRIVFERGLGIRANVVVLPRGYELVGSAVPAIVSTLEDGRVKASFLNDRDDTLPVRIVGRRLETGGER